jgi:DNA helicase-2/ATP-dependent DNA helicase PcrA
VRFIDSSTSSGTLHPDSVLRGLDSDQRTAVTAPTGIVVVRAGAGSGKTTVLTRRIAWRALSESADINRTLAITFTRQAATEMRARLSQFDLDGKPTIGTFHAIARRLMIQHYQDKGKSSPVIINNRTSVLSLSMGADARKGGLYDILAAIDWAHSHMCSPQQSVEKMTRAGLTIPLGPERFVEVFEAYEKTKKKRGVVDLNDFLTFVVHETRRDHRYLESVNFQFKHLSVDEAQDMNPLQYEFLKVLLGNNPDVFLVGDPNQAIYGFNGADKTLFDELPGIGAPAHVISLPSNYRCTPEIVNFAVNTLTGQGQPTEAVSRREPGAPVELRRCATETQELQHIVRTVMSVQSSESLNAIAVLCRTNAIAEKIREALSEADLAVRSTRRGSDWAQAVATATDLTGRESLATWASDVLDSGDYSAQDSDFHVARLVRQFLDDNRMGLVDGRSFGSWLATSADVAESDGVEVLTFHAAKGREWSHVIVAACEKGLLPHRSARGVIARAEEARLAYVAFTRAAHQLTITWTDQRENRSSGPSPFLPSLTTAQPSIDPPTDAFRARPRTMPTTDRLKDALHTWRQSKARQMRVEPDAVLSQRQLVAIVRATPHTITEIEQMTDPMFARRYGQEILSLILQSQNP